MSEVGVARWLFRPAGARPLAVVRIAIGSYALVWLLFSSPELLGLGGLDRRASTRSGSSR